MSRATLCTLLGELGYEGADALDPDSFEWPFQYDDARPILDWICSSLRPSNVLSLAFLEGWLPQHKSWPIIISGDGDGIHLAYSDFHPYLIGDSSCIKELNQWFAKQLDTCVSVAFTYDANLASLAATYLSEIHQNLVPGCQLLFLDSALKGPFRLVVEEGKSKCSWVSLEDISNIIVRADLEKSHHQRVPELQPLRSKQI